jgi:hypothetical protein
MLSEIVTFGKPKHADVQRYAEVLRRRFEEMGLVTKRPGSATGEDGGDAEA